MKVLNKNSFLAFTLIELLVSMTIIFIVIMTTYIPYNYYQNKAKLRQSTREIAQSLYEARNMAINWISKNMPVNWISNDSNLSIWIYFDSSESSKNTIKFFSYPYEFDPNKTKILNNGNTLKTLQLQHIQINSVGWLEDWAFKTSSWWLFFFKSITWSGSYYYWEWSNKKEIISDDGIIKIKFSYKNSTSPDLQREICYYTKTYISDISECAN